MKALETMIQNMFHKDCAACTDQEVYEALLTYTKEQLAAKGYHDGKKKIYYISAEFLIGKLLSNNLINLGIYDEVAEFLKKNGKSLAEIESVEPEPSLGNGGLGRLAACFLDSIATLGLPGEGIGLNYHLGLFKQVFEDNLQHEVPNPWITPDSWLTATNVTYMVPFRGFSLKSTMYSIDVAGYENKAIHLNLFDIDLADESMVHDGITFNKKDILHNLTLFLYPDDSDEDGRKLRVYQQYFMVSNAAQLILDEAVSKGSNLHDLADYAVVQINDTHPSMIIPEFIRLLGERGIDFDEAAEIVSHVCAYTNHTILAEALEKWPIHYLEDIVPQLVPIIRKLDEKVKAKYPAENLAIIDSNNLVHMAHMDIHYGFSINGVAALHTEILKNSELHQFYEIYPEKFNNKTNGITFRRWLMYCNQPLTKFISSLIGEGYKKDADELKKLLAYKDDQKVLDQLLEIKTNAKKICKDFVLENTGIEIDENSVFDIQIKRLHEYKRQQLNALYIIYKYLEIKDGKKPERPITFIFGAKAAPAYYIAKDIIHLLLTLETLIQNDPDVAPYMKLVMVENYNVSAAEKLIPACDISEQISLASKEASGTGNMKFMLNGAITLGTMDGANVEISDLVGKDNIYIFGESSDEIIKHYEKMDYNSRAIYEGDADIKKYVDFIVSEPMLKLGKEEHLRNFYNELLNKDWFMTLLDLKDYIKVKDQVFADYEDRSSWAKKMLVNIGEAGFFSSDRTIEQYNKDIWHLN
ncbi:MULTISPECIES: glycogen/starch/alpha-glucan phosphorylase [unclassified Ruminococcus]|jgi:starch phosphorylase|uniref:glycogen/starch/alpha-glucan phosphorylase n=1 Tax=Ruminococcus sp. 1001136B_160425_D2 TaxID=2787121 RepID=UPI001899C867|nr:MULTISPECIES: glycogen/starch/alpha-glucan phosphorylase [unclassified Ruminococcus]MDB8780120.1 glycogen/starch/alpha-glucan phosphorylase [Ruminococcus sp. 1001136sp1]MDB8788635.1 glycogen/starch/alpha-glucan phosphorylase [Ruminococcus sp. 1001136sp1]